MYQYRPSKLILPFLFLIGFAQIYSTGFAQLHPVIGLPSQWGQYEQLLPVLNPAFGGKEEDVGISIGNLRHLGLWKNNQTFFINGNVRIFNHRLKDSTTKKNFNALGAYLIGEDEGQYLHRTRGYGSYAYHLKLNKKYILSAGLSLGFMSYSISSNDYNSGGSASTLDGNLGILVYSDNSYLGLSSNQIFQGYVSPIQEKTVLLRHWNLSGGIKIKVNPWLEIRPSVLVRMLPGLYPNINLGLSGVLAHWLAIGVNYRHKENVTISLGLEKLPFGHSKIKALISYSVPLANYTSTALQAFEIILKYSLNYKSNLKTPKLQENHDKEDEN